MAKRKNDSPVRIDNDVLANARIAASYQGKSLADYISDAMRPIVLRDIEEGHAKLAKAQKPPKAGGKS